MEEQGRMDEAFTKEHHSKSDGYVHYLVCGMDVYRSQVYTDHKTFQSVYFRLIVNFPSITLYKTMFNTLLSISIHSLLPLSPI